MTAQPWPLRRQGGAARYINHCCDPNCYPKIIMSEGKPRITIYSKRALAKGEVRRCAGPALPAPCLLPEAGEILVRLAHCVAAELCTICARSVHDLCGRDLCTICAGESTMRGSDLCWRVNLYGRTICAGE